MLRFLPANPNIVGVCGELGCERQGSFMGNINPPQVLALEQYPGNALALDGPSSGFMTHRLTQTAIKCL